MWLVTSTSTVFFSIPAMASAVSAIFVPSWFHRPTIGLGGSGWLAACDDGGTKK